MVAILIMEMKGFASLGGHLARGLETVGVSPERVRSAGINIIKGAVEKSMPAHHQGKTIHMGGDTWYFTFEEPEEALRFAYRLLSTLLNLAVEKGIFYLKPSLALIMGEPKFEEEFFLDDQSIAAYKTADTGEPYHFYVLGKAVEVVDNLPWVSLIPLEGGMGDAGPAALVDWRNMTVDKGEGAHPEAFQVSLPTFLLESEVVYSHSTTEAIEYMTRQQQRSTSVLAFGGPVSLDSQIYTEYLRSTIRTLRDQPETSFTVLSYLPLDEAWCNYSWLELCRRLSRTYPSRYVFAAYAIPKGQLRPFSYHIYDSRIVHIGLRSFSPQKGTPTMKTAIMFRNSLIATRFKEEFLENWRRVGSLTEDKYKNLLASLKGLTPVMMKEASDVIDEIMKG